MFNLTDTVCIVTANNNKHFFVGILKQKRSISRILHVSSQPTTTNTFLFIYSNKNVQSHGYCKYRHSQQQQTLFCLYTQTKMFNLTDTVCIVTANNIHLTDTLINMFNLTDKNSIVKNKPKKNTMMMRMIIMINENNNNTQNKTQCLFIH